jgi:hypothetical protein
VTIESENRREDRLRRKARRQGLRLVRSRDRNPEIPGSGPYMIVDDRDNVVAGELPYGGMDLDAVEAALNERGP